MDVEIESAVRLARKLLDGRNSEVLLNGINLRYSILNEMNFGLWFVMIQYCVDVWDTSIQLDCLHWYDLFAWNFSFEHGLSKYCMEIVTIPSRWRVT